jgi:hypothetical protein
MSLSETELKDKALLSDTLFTNMERHMEALIEKEAQELSLFVSISPPARCSDGKRRSNLMDYVDFLFGDEAIEDVIERENVKTPGFTRSIHLNHWGFEIKFKRDLMSST